MTLIVKGGKIQNMRQQILMILNMDMIHMMLLMFSSMAPVSYLLLSYMKSMDTWA